MTDGDGRDARIAELEATVDGLTNQLVDLQERVRELETERGVKTDVETAQSTATEDTDRSVEELFAEAEGGGEDADGEDRKTIGDDIILG